MSASKGKISLFQAMLILLSAVYSPTLRYIGAGAAREAKQAAWLCPFIALAFTVPVVLIYQSIFKKYKNASFAEIIEDVLGLAAGKIVTIFYILFLTILLTLVTFNYADKLTSTVYPNVNILIFITIMLAAAAFVMRKGGIEVLARMNEIIIIVLLSVFFFLFSLAVKDIKISRLTPISYLDIIPLLKACLPVFGVWSQLSIIFLLSNYINSKEKIKKYCGFTMLLMAFLTSVMLIMCIGLLGASTVAKSPVPYITIVKQISVFEALERLEAAEVGIWIVADFVLASLILFAILNLYKSLFKLSDTRPLTPIYSVIIYFLVLIIGRNIFEQDVLGSIIVMPLNIFIGYVMPVLVFIVGKIRKKI